MLFYLGKECSICAIPDPSQMESITLSDRERYIIILNGKELGKVKEKRWGNKMK